MRAVGITAGHELRTTLGRKSFWLTTFLLPSLVALLVFVPQLFADAGGEVTLPGLAEQRQMIGYVDAEGLLETRPSELPPGLVREYESEAEAEMGLASGVIDRYYLIPEDYLESGHLTVVQARYQPLRAVQTTKSITYVLNTGIIGSEATARLLLDPLGALESRSLDPAGVNAYHGPATGYFFPYLLMFVLYVALAMTSGFMLQSVTREKENRTAEVLLSTVRPRDLMLGKIIGLSAVGLLQVAVWLAVIFSVLPWSADILGTEIRLSADFALWVISWTVVYFLLGYVMYSSLYALLGVLAPNARDANQFVFLAIIPLIIPLLFVTALSETPDGALSTALSLFPLTAPVAMVARIGSAWVPWWQLTSGAVGLAIFAYAFVLLAGRSFRADNLLSNRALTWSRLGSALKTWPARPASAQEHGRPPARKGTAGHEPGGAPGTGESGSKQRALFLGLVALVMLFFGVSGYARGDPSGLAVAAAGVVVAAGAYYRYRRRR